MEQSFSTQMNILNDKDRPNSVAYINCIFSDFIELSGDRLFGDDPSIIGGLAFLDDIPVTVIGQLRGNSLEEQINFNYSMTHPEGFRKALRLMKQAEKFKRPIICFIDTIGAYPGKQAEEHGQASAIANNLMEMMYLKVPIIAVLIGYGGSGGALALCVADRIAILENAVLSVISPKACAEILWKDTGREIEAVELLKMTSKDLREQGIIDFFISEPDGGAHTDVSEMASRIKDYLIGEMEKLKKLPHSKLLKRRQQKFRFIGQRGQGN
jgi:acetyl-CoA carboxylase carboxyl transferase subunit alpha